MRCNRLASRRILALCVLLSAPTGPGCRVAGVVATAPGDGGGTDATPRLDSPSFDSAGDNATGTGGAGGDAVVGDSGGAPGCTQCSADLHQITDCNGAVLSTCPASTACGGGKCIEPCQAAREAGSTQGCEFYSVIPPPEPSTRGSCFAALISNTWTAPITLTVEYGGTSLDVAQVARIPVGTGQNLKYQPLPGGQLAPGQMAVLFLSGIETDPVVDTMVWLKCPVTPGVPSDVAIDNTGLGRSFRISTTAPVAAFDIYPYGGSSSMVASATLLVPTSAWGTNYIATDGFAASPSLNMTSDVLGPSVQIVAAQDATNVTINPTAAIAGGGGVAAAAKGQPQVYRLSKGQVLQFLQKEELAGSVVSADKPVGVWGGSSDMDIPVDKPWSDCAHQQLVPVNLLGSEYVAARHRDRLATAHESVPWTLVGAVDNTTLTYDPAPPTGAPTTVNRGQVFTFSDKESFTVRSADDKHPFYLAGHMSGAAAVSLDVGSDTTDGDPETVNMVPPQQWLPRYTFLTDPTYGTSALLFVRQKAADNSFKDVTLDCLGPVAGWKPVGRDGRYQITSVDLITGREPNGRCDNGVHNAQSDTPFGLTVWGWDSQVSYAYPAGMSVKPINHVVVPVVIP